MRGVLLLLVPSILFSGGCAVMIAHSGTDLTGLKTKEEIHAVLGEPCLTGEAGGEVFDEYRTRRKVAEPMANRYFGPGYAMALVLTCGTAGLIAVPYELCLVGSRTLLGQTIRVTYDAAGTVANVELDGEYLFYFGRSPYCTEPSEPTAPPADHDLASPTAQSSGAAETGSPSHSDTPATVAVLPQQAEVPLPAQGHHLGEGLPPAVRAPDVAEVDAAVQPDPGKDREEAGLGLTEVRVGHDGEVS